MKDNLIGTTEAAQLLGISRIAVFKKIQKGHIEAYKVGRNYILDRRSLSDVKVRNRSKQQDAARYKAIPEGRGKAGKTKAAGKSSAGKDISNAVGRAMRQYAEALKKMDLD